MDKVPSWLLILGFACLLLPAAAVGQPAPAVAFDVEAATDAYLSRLTPEEKESSDAYFEGGYWLQLWGVLVRTRSLVVAARYRTVRKDA